MRFRTVSYKLEVPDWPMGESLRIGQLTDLHNGKTDGLADIVRGSRPDFLLATGDMITCTYKAKQPSAQNAAAFLRELCAEYPLYAVNGNHELRWERLDRLPEEMQYSSFRRTLEECGAVFLDGRCLFLEVKGLPLQLAGAPLELKHYRRSSLQKLKEGDLPPELTAPLFSARAAGPRIMLAHNPFYFPACRKAGADITLSGHLHGGAIRLPLLGGLFGPGFLLFPAYSRGLFAEDGCSLAVSAGLGTHSIPRLFNPREYVLLELVGTGCARSDQNTH